MLARIQYPTQYHNDIMFCITFSLSQGGGGGGALPPTSSHLGLAYAL